jgi:hypothetical protein
MILIDIAKQRLSFGSGNFKQKLFKLKSNLGITTTHGTLKNGQCSKGGHCSKVVYQILILEKWGWSVFRGGR